MVTMACERYVNAIQELVDGTLGPIRRAELDVHLDQCDACRRFADDLERVRELAASLERPEPPGSVWLQIAGRLRQEGRVAAPAPLRRPSHRHAALALAASLLLVVGGAVYLLYRGGAAPAPSPAATAQAPAPAADDRLSSVEAEIRLAEQHFQNAIAGLQEVAKSNPDTIDPQTAATLQKNLTMIDQAIAESRAALRNEPQSAPARNSLFEALRQKVVLLQDTIAVMNQMRRGDAAGVAEIVDGANKS